MKSKHNLVWRRTFLPSDDRRAENKFYRGLKFSVFHNHYSTIMPNITEKFEVTLKLKMRKKAQFSMYFHYTNVSIEPVKKNVYRFVIDPLDNQRITITATYDTYNYFDYDFNFIPQYNINKFFKVTIFERFNQFLEQNENEFLFETDLMLIGDIIKVTIPAEYSSLGELFTAHINTLPSFASKGTLTRGSCFLISETNEQNKFEPTTPIGQFKVEVIRDNKVIHVEDYNFDINYRNIQPLDKSLYTITLNYPKTLEEAESSHIYFNYTILFEKEKIESIYGPISKYTFDFDRYLDRPIVEDDFKIISYYTSFSQVKPLERWYTWQFLNIENVEDGICYIKTKTIQHLIVCYNEQNEFVTAFIIEADFSNEYLGQYGKFLE